MPLNKQALIRYRVINRCLIDNKFCSLEDLIDACERALDIKPLGERTIKADIHDMQKDRHLGYKAPIKNKRHYGYYYSDPEYSIDKLNLNRKEINALNFASTLMGKMNDTGLFNKFYSALQKIFIAVNIQKAYFDGPEFDFIDFEKVPSIKGSEFIQPIMDYIQMKKVIDIHYKSFFRTEAKYHTMHPYLLKEYRNRWYVIGHNEKIDGIMTLGLDRINSIEPAMHQYIERDFDAEEYFKNTVGVISPQGEPPEIRISVKKPQADYLITQPWHSTQTFSDNGDEVEFHFKVHPTYEFTSQVLGLGSNVVVLEPVSLREKIRDELKQSIQAY